MKTPVLIMTVVAAAVGAPCDDNKMMLPKMPFCDPCDTLDPLALCLNDAFCVPHFVCEYGYTCIIIQYVPKANKIEQLTAVYQFEKVLPDPISTALDNTLPYMGRR